MYPTIRQHGAGPPGAQAVAKGQVADQVSLVEDILSSASGGGGQRHDLLGCYDAEVFEQCGFAGAGASRNESAPARPLHDVQGAPELIVYLDTI